MERDRRSGYGWSDSPLDFEEPEDDPWPEERELMAEELDQASEERARAEYEGWPYGDEDDELGDPRTMLRQEGEWTEN